MQGMRDFISTLMCIHSRAADYLNADYQNPWYIPLPGSEDTTHRITLNDDILVGWGQYTKFGVIPPYTTHFFYTHKNKTNKHKISL